jgi:sugar transferase EpsL
LCKSAEAFMLVREIVWTMIKDNSKERLLDLCIAFPALVLSSPVLVIIALFIRIIHGRPVLFVQQRPGLHGKPFKLFKFRTMTNARNGNGELLPDGERLTFFGRLLRASSLDELPELFNIIKGDMRIVGPRPLLMEYLDRYSPEQARRHEVKPGLTGWAQVNGRNAISWREKFDLDVWYVDNRSFGLDLKIMVMTIKSVISCKGINTAGYATTPDFDPQCTASESIKESISTQ